MALSYQCKIILEKNPLTCKLETPTAVMMPNITRNIPPMMGVGMLANTAPILPNMPVKSRTKPPATMTILLPTCGDGEKAITGNKKKRKLIYTSQLSTWIGLEVKFQDSLAESNILYSTVCQRTSI